MLCTYPFTNDSYWLPADMEPRTALESLAKSIFEHHTKNQSFDPETSGVEWWTQVRKEGGAAGKGIGFHFDKDEQLHAAHPDLYVHPQLSCVTYLSDVGAPTMVVEQRISTCGDVIADSSDPKAFISCPVAGKVSCMPCSRATARMRVCLAKAHTH